MRCVKGWIRQWKDRYFLDNGRIDISSRAFGPGNSGGPVFVKIAEGNYVVVGIVSAGLDQQGFIVPISSIR
jgi:hypothetical protein